MGVLQQFFKYWLVDRHQGDTIAKHRTAFVQAALLGRASSPVYLLAAGVTKPELEAYLPLTPNETQQIQPSAYLAAYGVVDLNGHKHFFYENWFADYSFERSQLHAVNDWPAFTRHFIGDEL